MTRWCISRVFVLGLCVVVAASFASVVQGQEGKKNKVKVSGAEHQQRNCGLAVTAGFNETNNCAWMVLNFGDGTREQYWVCPYTIGSGSSKGTYRVVGDKICDKWEFRGGVEECYEVYRIGEDKYELWQEREGMPGEFKFIGTYYQLDCD